MVPKAARICMICFLFLSGISYPGGAVGQVGGGPENPLIAAVQIEEPWSSLGA